MKYINNIYVALLFMVTIIASCTPDKYSLGGVTATPEELVEGIAFEIKHDAENPNIVYLISKMDKKYNPLWQHPQGNAQGAQVMLKMPFEGTYNVTFGVQTSAGPVYGEPVQFRIDQFYADFVNDPLWERLTGGVGHSKTWIHDNGKYGLASGEVDYADPSIEQEYENFQVNWGPGAGHTGDDNIWKSTMTFTLEGGAFVETHNEGGPDESGTFMIDTDNYTLTFANANLIHTPSWENKTSNWSSGLKIFRLTENQLCVGVMREQATSGENPWWLIWNFVSQEYAENYVPEEQEDPVPDIDGDGNTILTTINSRTWQLSLDSPYDWAKLDGTLMNNFASVDDYLSTGWAAYDADMINATKFVFTSTSANGGTFVFSSYDAEDVEGEYTIDANNDLDFKQPLNALISQSDYGWISKTELATTSENKLRLIKTQTDIFGNVTDMWLGKRDPEKAEYTAYHFVAGSESSTDPAGAIKKMLCAHEWKIDVQGTKFGGPLTYAEPVSFPELTSAWTPDIPSNTWLMIDGDHGSMKFNQNGTVDITQKTVAEGAFDQTNYISGAWTYDDITQNLTLDIPILHADNLTFAVRDWGDARIQSIGVDFLRLCVVRDPVLSGESEYYLIFNYVPAE